MRQQNNKNNKIKKISKCIDMALAMAACMEYNHAIRHFARYRTVQGVLIATSDNTQGFSTDESIQNYEFRFLEAQ